MSVETLYQVSSSFREPFAQRPTLRPEIYRVSRIGNLSLSTVARPAAHEVNPTSQPLVKETAEAAKKVIFTTTGVMFIGYGLYRLATAHSMADVAVGAIFTYMGYRLIKHAQQKPIVEKSTI